MELEELEEQRMLRTPGGSIAADGTPRPDGAQARRAPAAGPCAAEEDVTTLTLVLWLQSGRKFQEVVVSADRPPVVHLLPRYDSGGVVMPHDLLISTPRWIAWPSSSPCRHAIADAEYDVGRRRFHYRETTGWKSRPRSCTNATCRDRDFPPPEIRS
jgi:hypothetical protein